MSFAQTIKHITSLPLEKKGWLVVFFVGSLFTKLLLKVISMPKLARLLGSHLDNRNVSMLATSQQIHTALDMGRLMSQVAKAVPWKTSCLPQALCVKWLLNRYGIPSAFYLGAAISSSEGMKAHAWVDVQQSTVIGGPQNQHYKVVATFTTPSLNMQ